jgi:hypothetical protein
VRLNPAPPPPPPLHRLTFCPSALFQNKTARGQDGKADDDELWTSHESAITSIAVVNRTSISTSGLDGRIIVWDLPSLNIAMGSLGL